MPASSDQLAKWPLACFSVGVTMREDTPLSGNSS